MPVADKIIALLDTLSLTSLDSLSPVRRRQFADLCRHWADIAERPKGAPAARPRVPASGGRIADALAGSPPGDVATGRAPAKAPARDAEL